MKKVLLGLFVVLGLISCSNEDIGYDSTPISVQTKSNTSTEFERIMENLKDSAIVYIESEEAFYKRCTKLTADYYRPYEFYVNPTILPRLSVTDYIATGYDSKHVIKTEKAMFSKPLADKIGVSSTQIFIVEYTNYSKNVQRALNSTFVADENCTTVAWVPVAEPTGNYGDRILGYASMKKNENVQTLETQCAVLAYTLLGQEVGLHYPSRNPNDYSWSYSCLIR